MAEFGYDAAQTLAPGQAAILENLYPCTRRPQNVLHENLSPIFNLRGNPMVMGCNCNVPDAQYLVKYSGNIAVPTGGTVGEIQLALSINGQILPLTIAAATPAAVEQFWHVSGERTIRVPAGCCPSVSVVNASVSADGTTPAPTLVVRNLNVPVVRTA